MTNLIVTLTGPSGVGKDTILNEMYLLAPLPGTPKMITMRTVISHTSRAPREYEKDGVDYHFVTVDEFERMVEEDLFVESVVAHGNYYGAARTEFETDADITFLVAEPQGASMIRAAFPEITRSIFVLPPRWEDLFLRLKNRGESDEKARGRIKDSEAWLANMDDYHSLLVNLTGRQRMSAQALSVYATNELLMQMSRGAAMRIRNKLLQEIGR